MLWVYEYDNKHLQNGDSVLTTEIPWVEDNYIMKRETIQYNTSIQIGNMGDTLNYKHHQVKSNPANSLRKYRPNFGGTGGHKGLSSMTGA